MSGGCPLQLGSVEKSWAQLGADADQMMPSGFPSSGLSSAPVRTMIRCGRLAASLNSGVPQLGQNRRRMVFPLSDWLTYSASSPVQVKPLVLKIALTDAFPDERY